MLPVTADMSDCISDVADTEVARWVRQARGGSQHAYANLYRRFAPLVHGILLGRFVPAQADDMTQECFNTAFARIGELREEHKFGAWMATMARRIKPSVEPRVAGEVTPDDLASQGASPDEVAESARVLRAIAGLPEAFRETLVLRLAEGMSGPEIAALTGMTHDSVRVNLHRGMAKLRETLGLEPSPAEKSNDRS